MRIMLDTHIAIWMLNGDSRLSPQVISILEDTTNELYVSIVSTWEVAIKHHKNPTKLNISPEMMIMAYKKYGINQIRLKNQHITNLKQLKTKDSQIKHSDPYDRLLLSQAMSENLYFLTHDQKLSNYDYENLIRV